MRHPNASNRWKRLIPTWWVRWVIYIVTPILLFYVVEDLRGHFALKKAKQKYLASGRHLVKRQIIGPKPADDLNFAKHPFIVDRLAELNNPFQRGSAFPSIPNYPKIKHPGPTRNADDPRYLNFVHFPEFYFEAKQRTRKQAAEELLTHYSPELFSHITDALNRPHCEYQRLSKYESWIVNAEDYLKELFDVMELQFICSHHSGDYELSATAICNAVKTGNNRRSKLEFIDYVNAYPSFLLSLQNLWMGLDFGGWNKSQLENILDVLEANQPEDIYNLTVEYETAIIAKDLNEMVADRFANWQPLKLSANINLPIPPWLEGLNDACLFLVPNGWIKQNQATVLKLALEDSIDGKKKIAIYDRYQYSGQAYRDLLSDLKDGMEINQREYLAIKKAIDLEIYRIDNGTYPEPEFSKQDQIGFDMGENGRPLIFYPETAVSLPLSEADKKRLWDSEHLWKYQQELPTDK